MAIFHRISVERGQFQGPLEIPDAHPPSNFQRFAPPPRSWSPTGDLNCEWHLFLWRSGRSFLRFGLCDFRALDVAVFWGLSSSLDSRTLSPRRLYPLGSQSASMSQSYHTRTTTKYSLNMVNVLSLILASDLPVANLGLTTGKYGCRKAPGAPNDLGESETP